MSEENQTNDEPKRLMPSNATLVGGFGGAGIAPLVVWVCTQFGLDMDAGTAAAAGAMIGNILGYFFDGGRK